MPYRKRALGQFFDVNDWAVAAGLTALGLLLAVFMLLLDRALNLQPDPNRIWLYGGDASGASSVLSVIASSMISVAGIVFSVNFVAVQLASSLYTPRVIRTMTRKRGLQVVLGAFLGTFVYSLFVLRAVRPGSAIAEPFVPEVAVTVAIILALCSVGVLIYFIHTGARLVQPSSLIEAAEEESIRILREAPEHIARELKATVTDSQFHDQPSRSIAAARSGYIQSLAGEELVRIVEEHDLVVRLDRFVGEFIIAGEPLATVWPGAAVDQTTYARLQLVWLIGGERTPEQDVEYGFRRVADIALKALSPAINDPTTAMTCIDSLCALIVVLAGERVDPFQFDENDGDRSGGRRVFWTARLFERCADVAFTQIRHYGASDPVVMSHLLDLMGRVAVLISPREREIVVWHARETRESALAAIDQPVDRARVEHSAAWISQFTNAAPD